MARGSLKTYGIRLELKSSKTGDLGIVGIFDCSTQRLTSLGIVGIFYYSTQRITSLGIVGIFYYRTQRLKSVRIRENTGIEPGTTAVRVDLQGQSAAYRSQRLGHVLVCMLLYLSCTVLCPFGLLCVLEIWRPQQAEKHSSSEGGQLHRKEIHRDGSIGASPGGSGRRLIPDARQAKAPPGTPGLVELGSRQDEVVPGRSTRATGL